MIAHKKLYDEALKNRWDNYVRKIDDNNVGKPDRFCELPTLKGFCVFELGISEKQFKSIYSEETVDLIDDFFKAHMERKMLISSNPNLKFIYEQYGNGASSIAERDHQLRKQKMENEKDKYMNGTVIFIDDSEYEN